MEKKRDEMSFSASFHPLHTKGYQPQAQSVLYLRIVSIGDDTIHGLHHSILE